MGLAEFGPLAARFRGPIVVTGFEPVDILQGVLACVEFLESGRPEVVNACARAVRPEGNPHAPRVMREVFTVVDRDWRGLGAIPRQRPRAAPGVRGLRRAPASPSFGYIADPRLAMHRGRYHAGNARPHQCPAHGGTCTPENPLGALMVANEGACAAYYHHHRRQPPPPSRSVASRPIVHLEAACFRQPSRPRAGITAPCSLQFRPFLFSRNT